MIPERTFSERLRRNHDNSRVCCNHLLCFVFIISISAPQAIMMVLSFYPLFLFSGTALHGLGFNSQHLQRGIQHRV